MGLVQHEGGPCGVLATLQVVLFACCFTCDAPFLPRNDILLPNLIGSSVHIVIILTFNNFAFAYLLMPLECLIFNISLQ